MYSSLFKYSIAETSLFFILAVSKFAPKGMDKGKRTGKTEGSLKKNPVGIGGAPLAISFLLGPNS